MDEDEDGGGKGVTIVIAVVVVAAEIGRDVVAGEGDSGWVEGVPPMPIISH